MLASQTTLPTFTGWMFDTRRSVGLYGEMYLATLFKQQGYKVSTSHKCGDLTIISSDGEIAHIEVKTARRSRAGTWQFCLYKAKHTNHHNADWVVLLCIGKAAGITPFVIPCAEANVNAITIYGTPQGYSGCYAKFRQSIRSLHIFEVTP